MPGLIGKKIGMTSVFSADGKNIPCTVIEVGPCVVTQVKTVEKDGYKAYQLGFGEAKENRTSQPMMGIFKKAGTTPKKHLAEFKFDEEYNLGDTITVEIFNDCKFVDVIGTSKGKGFQGVVKRHGFGEQIHCDGVAEGVTLKTFELGQVSLRCYTGFFEVTHFGLCSVLLFLLLEAELQRFVAVGFNCLNLSNNTRTYFDNSARNILTVGTENGCHSDFLSN